MGRKSCWMRINLGLRRGKEGPNVQVAEEDEWPSPIQIASLIPPSLTFWSGTFRPAYPTDENNRIGPTLPLLFLIHFTQESSIPFWKCLLIWPEIMLIQGYNPVFDQLPTGKLWISWWVRHKVTEKGHNLRRWIPTFLSHFPISCSVSVLHLTH